MQSLAQLINKLAARVADRVHQPPAVLRSRGASDGNGGRIAVAIRSRAARTGVGKFGLKAALILVVAMLPLGLFAKAVSSPSDSTQETEHEKGLGQAFGGGEGARSKDDGLSGAGSGVAAARQQLPADATTLVEATQEAQEPLQVEAPQPADGQVKTPPSPSRAKPLPALPPSETVVAPLPVLPPTPPEDESTTKPPVLECTTVSTTQVGEPGQWVTSIERHCSDGSREVVSPPVVMVLAPEDPTPHCRGFKENGGDPAMNMAAGGVAADRQEDGSGSQPVRRTMDCTPGVDKDAAQ